MATAPESPWAKAALEALQAELAKSGSTTSTVKEKKTPKKEEPLFTSKEDAIGDSFIELFGFKPTVPTTATKYDCPNHLKVFVPVVDDNYVLPHEATSVLVYAIENNMFPNMVGPTGSGKSTLVEQVCARLNRPFFRFNGRGDMETASLFGMMTVQNGETVWKDGTFTEAVKNGIVTLFDEYTATQPEINMSLQWLREHGGKLLLQDMPGDMNDRLVTPHKEFRLICADNTRGLGDNGDKFAGTNIQNTASLNRFDITIEHNYMPAIEEQSILTKKNPALTKSGATHMVKLATLIREGYNKGDLSITLSPRNLLSWAKKAIDWGDMETAFAYTYYNMLPDDTEKVAVKALYKTVFSKELKV